MPQRAELYAMDGRKLPQTWVLYLPQGAVIGFSKKECLAQISDNGNNSH